jgi:hypothetical protein
VSQAGLYPTLAGMDGIAIYKQARGGVARLGRHGSPIEPGQTGEVVSEIRHADFHAGAGHADGAHD